MTLGNEVEYEAVGEAHIKLKKVKEFIKGILTMFDDEIPPQIIQRRIKERAGGNLI